MRKFSKYYLLLAAFVALLFSVSSCTSDKNQHTALIPMPQKLQWNDELFHLADSSSCFVYRIVSHLPEVPFNEHEAYQLKITSDSLILEATTQTGIYWGQQTLKQLTQMRNGQRIVSGCTILDWPAFSIRGFMQDVGRNYESPEMLKEQIDVLSFYKMNVFHLHLTDNPGWRLESKIYPELNDPITMNRWPGKYYTQQEFVDLVDYCGRKNITLIPELDVPGHSQAFRNALQVKSMKDPLVRNVLIDLVDELCSLVPAEKMPYIHIGTDEVRNENEQPDPDLLSDLEARIKDHGRKVIVWRPGIVIENDSVSITQLWSSSGAPNPGHPYLDSRLNYLNHLDPLAGIPQLFYDRICGAAHGDTLRLGGILCCWNDNNVADEYDIIRQNPVYPGIVTYSETSWKGQDEDFGEKYLAMFPTKTDEAFQKFAEFEDRLIQHRDMYFQDKPFPYVKQTNIEWSIIGPFDNKGDVETAFPVEDSIKSRYNNDSMEYTWKEGIIGGTVHLQHFFGYPSYYPESTGTYYAFTQIWSPKEQTLGAWIGFHDWSRAGGRRGGPFPESGQWHNTDPKIWINHELIQAPVWNNPGLVSNTQDIPFTDENYFFRKPGSIQLKKGWNEILLKIPVQESTWKRMFTFVPVKIQDGVVTDVDELKYSSTII